MSPAVSPASHQVLPASAGAAVLPLVLDSPHSWREWPAGVPTLAPAQALLTSWDAWVDELWAHALQGQAPLLRAGFHRALIDANRARDDIDPSLLDSPWPGPLHPTDKSASGFGLIRRLVLPGMPMYAQPLGVAEVQARLQQHYDPYHASLAGLIAHTHASEGLCLHLNCHSMKSVGNAMNHDAGATRPDMVVSDLDGSTADPALTRLVARLLAESGYRVTINDPYKGGELVRRHSAPAQGRHSIQIEINRRLYMDEQRFEKSTGFPVLADALRRFVQALGTHLATGWGPHARRSA